MRTHGMSTLIGAMLALAFATCATYASAQSSTPASATAPAETAASPASPGRSDSALVRDVRRAFTRTPGLNFASIHIKAHNGVVTLTGWVPQHSQIERAGNAASAVRGVSSVSNQLTIRPPRGSGG